MKKQISLILALGMTLLMAACGTGTADPSQPASPIEQETTAEPTRVDGPKETLPAISREAVIEETVLVDEDGVKITATELTYGRNAAEISLLIENSTEKDLSFICESVGYSRNSINGFMIQDGYLNCDVAAGKKARDSVRFDYHWLDLFGIRELADIELGFDIVDEDYNNTYTGPRQLRTSAYEGHENNMDTYQTSICDPATQNTFEYTLPYFSTDAVYEEEGVRTCSVGMMVKEDGTQNILLELENTTDQTVHVDASNTVINDLAVSAYGCGRLSLTPGKRGVLLLTPGDAIAEELRELYGIGELHSFGVSLQQKDEDWSALTPEIPVRVQLTETVAPFDASGTEVFNQGGVRILSKTIVPSPSRHSEDLLVLLLAENSSGDTVLIEDEYDSLSVNGMMMDGSFEGKLLQDGQSGILIIELDGDDLEENQIKAPEDITELEIGIDIWQENDRIDSGVLKITY